MRYLISVISCLGKEIMIQVQVKEVLYITYLIVDSYESLE